MILRRVRPVRLAAVILAFLLPVLVASCGSIPNPLSGGNGRASGAPVEGPVGDCEYTPTGTAAKPVDPPSADNVPDSGTITFILKMTGGDVQITMDRSKAPCTVHSFESLAKQGYFDNTKCHRLVEMGIMVLQCGDPTGTGSGGPGYVFANETDGTEDYTQGKVAMANAGPNTNGSQFFMIWGDSTALNSKPDYTIFGEMDEASRAVVAGMAAEGQDGSNPDGSGRPINASEIVKVTER